MNKNLTQDTNILYSGEFKIKEKTVPDSPPIYMSTAYVMEDLDAYDAANSGEGYFYSRTANPNRDMLALAITEMEQGENSIICSSGMAAISTSILACCHAGQHILAHKGIYGETIELFDEISKSYGIQVSYADFKDLDEVKQGIRSNTVVIYTEVITNPLMEIIDVSALASISHAANTLLFVDSTFTTPFAIQPIKVGADIVIHSLTKFFNGHSDVTAGSITGSKTVLKKIKHLQLLLGSIADAYSSWLVLRSIRTMGLRIKQQMQTALWLAKKLENNEFIKQVNYPGLDSHPQADLAQHLFTHGYGSMLSFRVMDDYGKVNEFMRRLKVIRYLGTLGGYRTSIAHPATAFRQDFSQEQLKCLGLDEGLLRISTGIESPNDIWDDIVQALNVFRE